jgi:hypothetical protein
MAQNMFANVTVDPNHAKYADRTFSSHNATQGAAASGDLTVSYDSAKITTLNVFLAALDAAARVARATLK